MVNWSSKPNVVRKFISPTNKSDVSTTCRRRCKDIETRYYHSVEIASKTNNYVLTFNFRFVGVIRTSKLDVTMTNANVPECDGMNVVKSTNNIYTGCDVSSLSNIKI